METADFLKYWSELTTERETLIERRDALEMEVHELRKKIQHLDKILDNLKPLADLGVLLDISDLHDLGLTDAIRKVLELHEGERRSAADVSKELGLLGYDLSALSAPMASIYKILSRLAENPEEVKREKEDGRVYYTWLAQQPPF